MAKPLVIVQTQIFNEEKTILQIQMKIETQTITNTNRDTKIQIQWETFHQFGGCPRCGELVIVQTTLW